MKYVKSLDMFGVNATQMPCIYEQTLTDEQKAQARENIGAADAKAVSDALDKKLNTNSISTSLTVSGKVADDKAVGDALRKKLNLTGGTLTGNLYYKNTSNQFLRTDTIVNWAITNLSKWVPFISNFKLGRVQLMSYKGTGIYGEGNRKTLTFDFEAKLVMIKQYRDGVPSVDGEEITTGFSDYMLFAIPWETGALSGRKFSDPMLGYFTHLQWGTSGKVLSFWGSTASRHFNKSGATYMVFVIG